MTDQARGAGHTKGPWKVFAEGKTIQVSAGRGHDSRSAIVFWTGFDACDRPHAEKLANARLIAAAPDLLEALVSLDALWTEDFPHGPDGEGPRILADETLAVWRATRAAIARAKGEA